MEIFKATVKDIPELLNLQMLTLLSLPNYSCLFPSEIRSLDAARRYFDQYQVWKAVNPEGHIIGCITVSQETQALFIKQLSVLTEYQCQGVGKSLLRFVEENLPHLSVYTKVSQHLLPKSVLFFLDRGYYMDRIEQDHRGDDWLIMKKETT